jgi:enoyl-CoA hydratase/carnithine racemase
MNDAALYEVRDRVAIITINRPDRLNAWNERRPPEFRPLGG